MGLGLNITMIIFNFTEREMRVQTRRQAARPTSADLRQDRRLLRDSVISEPGPRTRDAGDWGILRMADSEGCGAHHAELVNCPANTQSVS